MDKIKGLKDIKLMEKSLLEAKKKLSEDLKKEMEKRQKERLEQEKKIISERKKTIKELLDYTVKLIDKHKTDLEGLEKGWMKSSVKTLSDLSKQISENLKDDLDNETKKTRKTFKYWSDQLVTAARAGVESFASSIAELDKPIVNASVGLFEKVSGALSGKLDKSKDNQNIYKEKVAEVKKIYEKSFDEIRARYKALMDEVDKADISPEEKDQSKKRLAAYRDEEIGAMRRLYDDDLAAYAEMQQRKLKVLIDSKTKEIEVAKKAGKDIGNLKKELSTMEEEMTALEIVETENSERKKYQLKMRKYREELFKLNELEAGKERSAEADRKRFEIEKKMNAEKLAEMNRINKAVKDNYDIASNVAHASFDLFDELDKKKKAKMQEEIDAIPEKVEAEIEASNESYNAQIENATNAGENTTQLEQEKEDAKSAIETRGAERKKELEDKIAEMEKKGAARRKALRYADAVMGTANAVINALATQPFFVGLAMAAVAAAMGAAQIASINNTPVPKAARGGLIQGLSHVSGGTLIEAEGGEAIINKRSTGIFAPLLSAINEAGGGVPFASPFSDGGFAQREYQRQSPGTGITQAGMVSAIAEAVAKQPIYVAVEDIHKADRRYAEVQDISGKF